MGKTVDAVSKAIVSQCTFYILKGMLDAEQKLQPLMLDSQSYKSTLDWIATLRDGMVDKLSIGLGLRE